RGQQSAVANKDASNGNRIESHHTAPDRGDRQLSRPYLLRRRDDAGAGRAIARMDWRAFYGPARRLARQEGRPARPADVPGGVRARSLSDVGSMADAQPSGAEYPDPPQHDK